MQLLKLVVAQHETVFRRPTGRRPRNGFDRIAQAYIGGDGLFDQAFLLRHVHCDTDQVGRRPHRSW